MITYKTYLMYKETNGATYDKLVDIKDFSDLGGDPEKIERTTLSDGTSTFEKGIQQLEPFEFTANYTKEDFNRLNGMEEDAQGNAKTYDFGVWFGGEPDNPSGVNGKYNFKGQISTKIVGAGVNAVVEMKVTITPVEPPEFIAPETTGTYSITYNANTGSGNVASQTYLATGAVVRLSNGDGLVAPEGKHFIGWDTSSSAENPTYEGGESYTVGSADVTLYAIWANNA